MAQKSCPPCQFPSYMVPSGTKRDDGRIRFLLDTPPTLPLSISAHGGYGTIRHDSSRFRPPFLLVAHTMAMAISAPPVVVP